MAQFITLRKIINDPFNREEGEPEPTVQTDINVDTIRNYYPRKNGAQGTRITFTDGGGYAVLDDFLHVRSLVRGPLALEHQPS